MCGRYTLTADMRKIAETFGVSVPPSLKDGEPRYNIAPTQDVVTLLYDSETHLDLLRWGLIPSWAKEEAIGSRMINARAETLAEKPSFKRLLTGRRCLLVADGFYEWKQEGKSKVPMYFTLEDNDLFTFAGLWDSWKAPDGRVLRTCTIITTEPNETVSSVHNRMPVILGRENREAWLDPDVKDEHLLTSLLKPYREEMMTARAVSKLVNNPQMDSAEILA